MQSAPPTASLKTSASLRAAEEVFVRACVDPQHPAYAKSARYLTARRLREFCSHVLSDLADCNSTRTELLAALLAAGIVEPVCQDNLPEPVVFWLKVRGGHRDRHNPLEVLAAAHSDAVISHHTCLAHHSLTTARPTAWFVSTPPSVRFAGQTLGALEGLKLVTKELSPRLRFGTVKVWTDAAEAVTVFDVERSLMGALDTPLLHGGPAAVVEAWDNGAEVVRESVLVDYLRRWNSPILWRRVGAMAERASLAGVREACEAACATMTDIQMTPSALILGASAMRFDERWKLELPWS